MKICVLYDSYEQSRSVLKEVDMPCDPSPYLQDHHCESVAIHKATAVQQIIALSRKGYDVFVNLCDGAWDEDRPGIEVVQALERLGLAFTGADTKFFEPSREKTKLVCHYGGIGTPAYVMAQNDHDIEFAANTLRFPLIVKHPSSYSSIGLTPASRVERAEDLAVQVNKTIMSYGAALIEEFIEGREFTVLVAENPDDPTQAISYKPVEFRFPPGETFKHFDLKWLDYHGMSAVPVGDPELEQRLRKISSQLFLDLQGTGYGRCDIRMNHEGELFILEINPNCGVFYDTKNPGSADLILLHDPAGHVGFANTIVQSALKRNRRQQKPWKRMLHPHSKYGMYAVRHIAAGEVVEVFEEQPHFLVTKSHVMRHWNDLQKRWFAQYAYPITEEVYVMWSHSPEEWKPINHSCQPNSWLDGLNLVACRNIESGEQISLDYATFCGPTMEEFACHCGSPLCRGTIRGTDHHQPFLDMYGNHLSDYVRTKRQSSR